MERVQSSKGSAVETVLNVGSGYFIAFGLNLCLLPFFVDGIQEQDVGIALIIGVIYTSISMMRSFIFRRLFNKATGIRKWL
jgi:hypothetical protein